MAKSDLIELDGVVEDMSHGFYIVSVSIPDSEEKKKVQCRLSGRMRKNFIRVIIGDSVTIQVSPYDLSKGIITYRRK